MKPRAGHRLTSFAAEAVKELARIAIGSVTVLLATMLALHLCAPIPSGSYLYIGVEWILLFSLLWSAWRIKCSLHTAPRAVVATCISIFCISTYFYVLIPVSIERSITLFLLGQMNAHPEQAYRSDDLQTLMTNGYLCHNAAVIKRMNEQQRVGNITQLTEGRYALTPQGVFLAGSMDKVAAFFSVPQRKTDHSCSPDATHPTHAD